MNDLERKLKRRLAWLAGPVILLSAPALLADVELVPGHIVGNVAIGTDTIDYMVVRASGTEGQAQQNLSPNTSAAPYDLTVNVPSGGSASYSVQASNVRTRDAVAPPWDYDYTTFPSQSVSVSEGAPATADFELAAPNLVEGTVSLAGSGQLSYMYVYAYPTSNNGFSHYTQQHADNATRNALPFAFPVSGGDMRCSGTAYLTDGTRINLAQQVVSPVGGIVTCDWAIDTPDLGQISGSIGFSGPNPLNRSYVYTTSPTSRSWNMNNPDNPDDYVLPNLSEGTYTVSSYVLLNAGDDQFYFPNAAFNPARNTTVAAGDDDVIDISACQAGIEGTVSLTGAVGWDAINYAGIYVQGLYQGSLPNGGPTQGGSSSDSIDPADGAFDLVVSPGPWYLNRIYLRPIQPDPAEYYDVLLQVYDRSAMYTGNPADPAACGSVEYRDFEYDMGEVTVNFSIAGADTFSDPRLYGYCYQYDDGGNLLYYYYMSSTNSYQDNVSSGFVTFVGPEAECTNLQAQAYVGGTLTTFGEVDIEVIGGGQVVVDIGGPGLTLAEPEAGLCLDAEETTVTGTATDDVGVASVTVNGVSASLSPAGGEGTLSTDFSALIGLSPGANLVETIATDTSGKVGSDTRTIYRDAGPPSLEWLPLNGATTPFLSIDVEGVVSDDVGIDAVTVNGAPVALSAGGAPGEYTFSVPVALALGSNMITVAVTEQTGCEQVVEVREITVVENQPPVANAGGPYVVDEGASVALDGSASSDPDGDPLTFEWDFDYDGATFDVDGSGSATPTFPAAALDGPSVVTVAVRVTDTESASDIAVAEVTVHNVAPELGDIGVVGELVPVGTEITASADFTDPGAADTHSANWNWGDSSAPGTVSESGGSGSVSDSHVYTDPGVYTIELSIEDDDGGADSSVYQYVVVYDPDGSFVTGGGTIDSPAGAYLAQPELTGIANFGFVSKYKKGASEPIGHTEFQFHAAGLDFKSTEYQWLVVAGARAQFKGVGTIKDTAGSFGFMLTAIDGDLSGGGGSDKFRIKIWDAADDSLVIYDNQLGGPDDADPSTVLRSGSVVIHSKGKK